MLDRRIKLRQLRCFVEVVRQGSLKRASETLHLTQPAVSKTLKELEGVVGAVLLTRSRSGVALTPAGEILSHFAEMSLAALQHGLDGVAQLHGPGRGRGLVVGALPSVAAGLLPRVAAAFGELAPNVVLGIRDGPHDYLLGMLREGGVDMVIGRLGAPEAMQNISFTQLYSEEVVFVVRPGHPALEDPDLGALDRWPVIYPPPGAAIRPLVEGYLIGAGVGEVARRIETVSDAFARVHTRESDAIWIISHGVVRAELAEGRLVRLPFDTGLTRGPVGLMRRAEAEPSPEERLLIRTIHAAIDGMGLAG